MDRAKRRDHDACGTAHSLDLIGDRWALLVMRELMLGPKRFTDIRGGDLRRRSRRGARGGRLPHNPRRPAALASFLTLFPLPQKAE